ncbi:MAG: carbohydrate ABC transporter permease [Pleomorphochaeta sp.]
MQSKFKDKKVITFLVLPGILIMLLAIATPIIISFGLSFVKWTGFGKMKPIGFDNYLRLLKDPIFFKSIRNVFVLIFVTVVFQNTFAFILAMYLTSLKQKLSNVLRTIYFIPATLSLVVVTKLWVNIFNPSYGLLNKLLASIGLENLQHAWIGDTSTALGSVIWIIVWQGFGWALLFYYSGIVTVPEELKEAAQIDGANKLTLYSRVIIPYIMPIVQSIIIIDVTSSLKQMEMIYLSTAGGPGDTTQFIALYLYQRAFKYSEYGYGNAISVIFVILAFVLTILIQKFFEKRTDYL